MHALGRVPLSSVGVGLVAYDCDEVLDELAALFRKPAWMASALCRQHPEVNFFPDRGDDLTPATAICARCPVRDECLAYAVDHVDTSGVWGGTSEQQRGGTAPQQDRADYEYPQLRDGDWLRTRYVGDGLSLRVLADEIGCSATGLRLALRRHGIPARAGGRPSRVA